jgi:hypothetical protein
MAHGQWEEPGDIHNTDAIFSDEEADKARFRNTITTGSPSRASGGREDRRLQFSVGRATALP